MTAIAAVFVIMVIWRLELISFGNANSAKAAEAISMLISVKTWIFQTYSPLLRTT
jgi:hypothetical protein